MIIYAQDNDGDLPRAGGPDSVWTNNGEILNWKAKKQDQAFGFGRPGATITASLYLTVKHAETPTKVFVCGGDAGAKEFELSNEAGLPDPGQNIEDVTDVHDFGPTTSGGEGAAEIKPGEYVSYSYHQPYDHAILDGGGRTTDFALTRSNPAATPVCADRSPFFDKNAENYINGTADGEDQAEWDALRGEYVDRDKTENSASHQREGQNVMFLDASVSFEPSPNCGIANDNIWKYWEKTSDQMEARDKELGSVPWDVTEPDEEHGPMSKEDAYLVNELN
jgi:hypothetical protein